MAPERLFLLGTSTTFKLGLSIDDYLKDPKCNPDAPIVVKWQDVENAMKKIKNGIIRTPCSRTRLSETVGIDLYFKKDFMQYTGSFKDRGALNALLNLSKEEKSRGVIAVSAGNHAQGMAHQGLKLGIPVTVIMPVHAPLVKINSCKRLKANIQLHGDRLDESYVFAMKTKNNKVYINGYDHPHIIAGQGSIAIEILEDVPDADYIMVPIGGGGLIAGVCAAAKHLKPSIKIIGVESSRCPSWTKATKAGHPVECEETKIGAKNSIADGLAVVKVGCNAFATANPLIDKVVTISEDYIILAILRLMEHEKCVVEGGGAAGFAAILAGKVPELKGKKVVCLLCGGNIDIAVVGRVIERGLAMDGRLCRFSTIHSDRPGELAQLSTLIGNIGANIREVQHDHISLPAQIHSSVMHLTVEVRDTEHKDQLKNILINYYGGDLTWKN